jgi:dTDP-glucose 4,6-dehydratase
MTTKILVTGGAGFIGSHYVRTVLGAEGPGDVAITVLDKLTYAGNPANLDAVRAHPGFAFVEGDICDPELVGKLMADHDQVVHFAAESHVDRSIDGGAEFVRTNVVGTHTLIDAAHRAGIKTFVHISTDEVYGSIDEGSWREDHILEPNSPYSAAKAGSDLIARAYAKTYGLNISITRCSNNYGPYHFPEKVIPLFVTNLLDGHKVPLYGAGANVRDWLFVDDHCRGIQLVVEKGLPGEYCNIGGGRELSNKELTEKLLAATDRDWSYVENIVDPRGGGHDLRYSVDYSKTAELGYAPRMTFEDGLALTVQWYRDNRAWWEPLKAAAATALR